MASALKYPFLDCDTLIEKMAGCTVAQIFADEGEESWRDLESQVLHVGLPVPLRNTSGSLNLSEACTPQKCVSTLRKATDAAARMLV